MNKYYDGKYLLNKKDINGNVPEIFMCTSNRSAGKTTYFGRYCINRFIKHKEKFGLIYRFKYELDSVADKFFKDIGAMFFTEYELTSEKREKGIYHELFLKKKGSDEKGESCGYALALNSAESIKKNSHLLSDVKRLLFDEFQSETNTYCPKEVEKLISLHTSIARGAGESVRYLPLIMLSNPVSIINPYYTAMDISARLKQDTKFLRGDGFVLEQGFNEAASEAQKGSAFNRAFYKNAYVAYSAECVYLNDNLSFIDRPSGHSTYLGTLKYKGNDYALREFADDGIIYVDKNADYTYPYKISVTTSDHQINYVMLKRNDIFISSMRYYFEQGAFRFKDLESKEALMKLISY